MNHALSPGIEGAGEQRNAKQPREKNKLAKKILEDFPINYINIIFSYSTQYRCSLSPTFHLYSI